MESEPKIISCEVLRNEVERVNPGYEVDFFEGALHDYPDRMRVAIQERIDATPGEREILLCCGRCSNGTVGLHAGPHRLVLPAARRGARRRGNATAGSRVLGPGRARCGSMDSAFPRHRSRVAGGRH